MTSDETKRNKAKQLRYKKPIAKNLNIETIQQDLWDIQEECENVRWYTDSEDGNDSLINALAGDEDEAYEFRMMFADLCAECERMTDDLEDTWIPEYFDRFFVAAGAGDDYGGLLGYDSYEGDYYGLDIWDSQYAEDESRESLKKLTKDELIATARKCFGIYQSYIGLRHRYDCIKTALDILKDRNTGYLQYVRQIDEAYGKANEVKFMRHEKATKEFDDIVNILPSEAWLQ